MVTLRDVASRSGVSVTTVSRILNGRETGVPIREATRERVVVAARDLGYKPNLLARALRGSRSSLLGVIIRDVSDPFHTQVLRGVNEVARVARLPAVPRPRRLEPGRRRGLRLDVRAVPRRRDPRSSATSPAATRRSTTSRAITPTSSASATGRGRVRVPGVYVDNEQGTLLALEHLWSLGHRSIVCVVDERMADGPFRAEVYEAFMRDHGVGDRARTYRTTQPDPEPGYRLGRELFAHLDRPNRPTAVFAASDTIAIGLLQAAFQARVVVPDRALDRRLRRHRHRVVHDPAVDDDQPGRMSRWAGPPPTCCST